MAESDRKKIRIQTERNRKSKTTGKRKEKERGIWLDRI